MNEAVAVYVTNSKGEVALGKKKKTAEKYLSGSWHIPGEMKITEEEDEIAAKRCLKEELGLTGVSIIGFVGEHETPRGTLVRWYIARTDQTKLHPSSDLEDAMWVKQKEVINICPPEVIKRWPKWLKVFWIS